MLVRDGRLALTSEQLWMSKVLFRLPSTTAEYTTKWPSGEDPCTETDMTWYLPWLFIHSWMPCIYTIAVSKSSTQCTPWLTNGGWQTTRLVLNLRASNAEAQVPKNPSEVELPDRISFAQRTTEFSLDMQTRTGHSHDRVSSP